MRLTKFSHSCIRLENEGKTLVFDPGNFSEVNEALAGADYLFITHAHPDHYDAEKVNAHIAEHPRLRVYAPAPVAEQVLEAVPTATVVSTTGGEEFSLDGFEIRTYGGQHALIHPLIQTIPNVAYLVNGSLYHPGDSLVVPQRLRVETLLLPIHAPWSKVQEVIDFMISTGAQTAYPIHDAMISDNGRTIIEGLVTTFGTTYGTGYRHLSPGDTVDLSHGTEEG